MSDATMTIVTYLRRESDGEVTVVQSDISDVIQTQVWEEVDKARKNAPGENPSLRRTQSQSSRIPHGPLGGYMAAEIDGYGNANIIPRIPEKSTEQPLTDYEYHAALMKLIAENGATS